MGNPYEDWWVDPKVVDRAIIDKAVGLENPRNDNTQFSIMPITAILEE